MKKPVLGKQTFLRDNTLKDVSSEKFHKEIYEATTGDKPFFTGRYFLVLKEGISDFSKTKRYFKSVLGLSMADIEDFGLGLIDENNIKDADALIYNDLGIALVGCEEEQLKMLHSKEDVDYIIEPEKIVYVPDDPPADSSISTNWGLNMTNVAGSNYSGKDIPVAVLDTGFDSSHPDFKHREINTASFVPCNTTHDAHGHGTHCIGIACGSTDMKGLRYGVAKDSIINACKVVNDDGSGAQSWIINGINWAKNNGCKVISLSLGSRVFPGQSYDIAYERAANNAISKGSVIIAAAGNESRRYLNRYNPVASPADCPSVLAVAAIDHDMNIADFSNRSINPNGKIDIAAPGVMIYSSYPRPLKYRTISGTSMAAPHVAGITAMIWEKHPKAKPYQVINELLLSTKRLPIPSIDVGVGLSIAP